MINDKKKQGKSRLGLVLIGILLLSIVPIVLLLNNHNGENVDYNLKDDFDVKSSINSFLKNGDLIIEYENPNNEKIWIEGLPGERYSINDEEIIIYDYHKERFNLHIGEESDIYEFGEETIDYKDKTSLDKFIEYDEKTKELVIFEDKFILEDVELTKIKLTTPLFYQVHRGINVTVFKQNISNYGNYSNFLTGMEIINLKTNKIEDKTIYYQYLTYENVSYELKESNCYYSESTNNSGIPESNCFNNITGLGYKIKENWIDIDLKNLPEGEYTIRGITDVKKGDSYEWIPTYLGNIEVKEWAVWTESLNANHIAYYKMDETSGTVIEDYVGEDDNGTVVGGTVGQTGKINTGYQYVSNDYDYVQSFSGNDNWTITIWGYMTNFNALNYMWSLDKDDGLGDGAYIQITNGGQFSLYDGSGSLFGPSPIFINRWTFFAVVKNGPTSYALYSCSDNSTCDMATGTLNDLNVDEIVLGYRGDNSWEWVGYLDELSYWERALTSSEIDDLFNSGDGLPYTQGGGDTTPPNFTTIPNNQSIFYLNETLNVTFIGIDETEFSAYKVNDTTNFRIGYSSGFLVNNTPLSAGNYQVNVTINDTSNNINWTIFNLEVNQSLDSCNVILNDTSPITFPEQLLIHTNCSSAYTLKLNGTSINNDSVLNSGSGGYNISVERTDSINYSNIFDEKLVSVLKNPDNIFITFNETSPITFPKIFISYINSSAIGTLSLNGTSIDNASEIRSGANYYNISFLRTDTQNYSVIYDEEFFTINKNSGNCQVLFNETSPILFPKTFTSFTDCSSAYNLYRNGTTISNNSEVNSGANYFNFSVLRTDSINYSNIYDDEFFTVNKAIPTGSLTNNESWTETYPTSITIGLSESNAQDGDVSYVVWRDNLDIGTSESVLLGVSTYQYILNTTGGTNYSSASLDTETLTININNGIINVLFNDTSPIVYPKTFLAYSDSSTEGTLKRNGTTIANNSEIRSGAGYYNISFLRTDTQNYSVIYDDNFFTVSKSSDNCQVLFNETSPHLNTTAFVTYTDCTSGFLMYLNGTHVSNNSQQYPLNASVYNYSVLRNDSLNYTNYFDDVFFKVTSPTIVITIPSPYDDLTKSITRILQALIILAAAIISILTVRTIYEDERTLGETISIMLYIAIPTFILILLMPIMVSYIASIIN